MGLLGRQDECAAIDRLPERARAGRSQVLVLRGDPGIGKTSLLDHLAGHAPGCRVVRAAGVESEQELVYSGLHQLCAPFLDHVTRLPGPQRDALGTAFGLSAGGLVNRFLVGLGVLTLLAEVAEGEPLVCLVDDAQWLDRMSAQVLAFVARRLLAERIALVFATRDAAPELAGLPELVIGGLNKVDAGVLLDSVVPGPVDPRVRDRVIAEARGNPLAIVELPRAWTEAELTDGFTAQRADVEQGFVRQVDRLPADTRRLLLVAAAEPLGDATLLWAAAGVLGLGADPGTAAEESGLIEFGPRVRFRHPLVRSAVYRSASTRDRQDAHRALAEVTTEPDRRAWHRALATVIPDEDIAVDLERSADRVRARGGLVAAAAVLEHAARLTPAPDRRADRELAAARLNHAAGVLAPALDVLTSVDAGPVDVRRAAEVTYLRGRIAVDQRRGSEAAGLLLDAAHRLAPLDPDLAREAHLAAIRADPSTAAAARSAPRREPPRPVDLVLDALASRLTEGYTAEPLVKAAEHDGVIAAELGDFATARTVATRQVQLAREMGALVTLQSALDFLAQVEIHTGDLVAAEAAIAEERSIADVTRTGPVGHAGVLLAAFRGQQVDGLTEYASAVLHNGLGRHDTALDAAARVPDHALGTLMPATVELAEAASRTGDDASLATALNRSAERARATPTDWHLGIDARFRALAALGDPHHLHRESLDHLARTPMRVDLARGHLLFGEWLRREGHRVEARDHLRTAHDHLTAMRVDAFAARARRELLATGETVRKRAAPADEDLTAQEFHIARLAREGLSNPEIGTRLFISPRTVEWHLRKVFTKLGIRSRRQLRDLVLATP
ncbi:helix-turn-helix transcriptional regulator [Actinokineospora inagensis]|uniref:helix-turn-helix transcriptional regulator n=1 Tax=Actinokineospora inagensis TaxID=103730 RepID=UPI000420E77E|nr:LuxR family transcriptional regulator [Actinokineospora inagensis]